MESFKNTKPTVSPDTADKYLKRFRRMRDTLISITGRADLTPDEVVANMILRKHTLSMASWRAYKSAVLYILETRFPQLTTAIEQLRAETSEGLAKTTSNTSGRKKKSVPDEEWKAIRGMLVHRVENKHMHARGVLDFLDSTLLTGLRPGEWAEAEESIHTESGRATLRVKNAKHSNGRANGEYREFFIDELSAEEREAIRSTLTYCKPAGKKTLEKIMIAVKNEFEAARDQSLLKSKQKQSSITLYSFRHQFIADAKLTFEHPELISALVGHSSTRTAFAHYGKRRNAKGKVKVAPTPESVAEVLKIRQEQYVDYLKTRRNDPSAP